MQRFVLLLKVFGRHERPLKFPMLQKRAQDPADYSLKISFLEQTSSLLAFNEY